MSDAIQDVTFDSADSMYAGVWQITPEVRHLYKTETASLDEYQRKIVELPGDRAVKVVANAGSGKTRTLIARALRLAIEEKVHPKKQLLITFTNKAAREIKERWEEKVNPLFPDETVEIPWMTTIHSMGWRLLYTHTGWRPSIINEWSQAKLLRKVIAQELGLDKVPQKEALAVVAWIDMVMSRQELWAWCLPVLSSSGELEDVIGFEEAWSRGWTQTLIQDSHWGVDKKVAGQQAVFDNALDHFDEIRENHICRIPEGYGPKNIAKILRAYVRAKAETSTCDFNDCIFLPLILGVQHPAIHDSIRTNHTHVQVDEAQDIDAQQWTLIRRISKGVDGVTRMTLIGDVKQTLYTWRNAQPLILEHMDKVLGEPIVEGTVLTNYRSPFQSVSLSNMFAKRFKTIKTHPSDPFKPEENNAVRFTRFNTTYDELNWISSQIRAIQKETGCKWSDFTILNRTNRALLHVESALIKARIPYQLKHDRRSLVRKSSFKSIYSIYSLLLNKKDAGALMELVENIKGIGDKFVTHAHKAIMEQLSEGEKSAERALEQYPIGNRTQQTLIAGFLKMMEEIRECWEAGNGSLLDLNREIQHKINRHLALDGEDPDGRIGYALEIEALNKVFGTFNNIYIMLGQDRETQNLTEMEKFLEVYSTLQLSQEPGPEKDNRVMVTTIHGFKGRESDYIYYCGLARLMAVKHEEMEDERCAMYVAITRSRKQLIITYADRVLDYANKLKQAVPSMLLDELMEALKDTKEELNAVKSGA